jgi:Dolichyl-phosphate-mannose-protein mannosyltransferase
VREWLKRLLAPGGPRGVAVALVGLGLAGLGAAVALHAKLDPDESQHLHAAWLVAQGRVPYRDFWEHHMPLFHYALAPLLDRVPEGPAIYFAGRSIMGLVAAGTLALVYTLGGRLGPGVGAAAVVLLAVQFRFLQHSILVRPDGPALLTWLAAVAMLVRWREHERPRRLLAAGFWLGATAALTPKAAFVGLGAVAVVLAASIRPPPVTGRMARRLAWLAMGTAAPLAALMLWLGVAGGGGTLRAFAQDVIVANLGFPDFVKQTPIGGEAVGFALLGLAGVAIAIREHGWRVLQHPLHGPLLIPAVVVSVILAMPTTPAVYTYTWLPVLASGSCYAGYAFVAGVERWRGGEGRRGAALAALIVAGALVVPVVVVGVLAFPRNRANEADLRLMRRELAYACPGDAVLDGGPLAVFRRTALRYPSLVRGVRTWIARGVISVEALADDLRRSRAPVGVFDSRLRSVDGPVAALIATYYVREPDGLLVAGASLSVTERVGEAAVDVLVPARYAVTAPPGLRVSVDGASLASPMIWLSEGRRHISWSGGPGTIRLAIVPCAEQERGEESWHSRGPSTTR